MQLSAPTRIVFIIAVILAIISLLPVVGLPLAFVASNSYWFLLAGFIVLAVGNLLNGL